VSSPLSFAQVESVAQADTARALFREYQQWLTIEICFQSFEAELSSLPMPYLPPRGALLLALEADEVAGCGAFRPLADGSCELKRMFLRPRFRGKGRGRRMATALIGRARAAGYPSMRLDTFPLMREAVALYQSLGFRQIERYYDNPHPDALFYQLDLR